MVYDLYRALPGDRAFCHRRMRDTSRPLDASIEASGPHDFAVRIRAVRQLAHPRPSHPAPRFVTLRNAPRSEQDGASGRFDLPDGESQIFLRTGLDRTNQAADADLPVGRTQRASGRAVAGRAVPLR